MHPQTTFSKHMAPLPAPCPQFSANGIHVGIDKWRAHGLRFLFNSKQGCWSFSMPFSSHSKRGRSQGPGPLDSSPMVNRRHGAAVVVSKGQKRTVNIVLSTQASTRARTKCHFPRGRALRAARFFPFPLYPQHPLGLPAWEQTSSWVLSVMIWGWQTVPLGRWAAQCFQGTGANAHLLGRPDRTNVRGIRSRLHCADAAVDIRKLRSRKPRTLSWWYCCIYNPFIQYSVLIFNSPAGPYVPKKTKVSCSRAVDKFGQISQYFRGPGHYNDAVI